MMSKSLFLPSALVVLLSQASALEVSGLGVTQASALAAKAPLQVPKKPTTKDDLRRIKIGITPQEHSVALVALGCPKNTVDAEVMLGDLQRHGLRIVKEPEEADTDEEKKKDDQQSMLNSILCNFDVSMRASPSSVSN